VRGRGLLRGIEFEALDWGRKHSARALSDAVTDNALKLGLSANIVRAGASEGVMRIAPPLTATEAEIDLGLELQDAALEQTLEQVRQAREAPVFPRRTCPVDPPEGIASRGMHSAATSESCAAGVKSETIHHGSGKSGQYRQK
jgi:hypothetical protein